MMKFKGTCGRCRFWDPDWEHCDAVDKSGHYRDTPCTCPTERMAALRAQLPEGWEIREKEEGK